MSHEKLLKLLAITHKGELATSAKELDKVNDELAALHPSDKELNLCAFAQRMLKNLIMFQHIDGQLKKENKND